MNELLNAVEAAKRGESNGFQTLYSLTSKTALAVIRRYCDRTADYEDLLQDTYVRVYKSINDLRDARKAQAWINRIAANTAIRHNMKKNPSMFSDLADDEGMIPEFADTNQNHNPELIADQKAVSQAVRQILDSLPEDQRAALWMVYGQNVTIREMAQQLGISENTIKSRLYQGRKKLLARREDFLKLGVDLTIIPVALLVSMAFQDTVYGAVSATAGAAAAIGLETAADSGSAAGAGSSAPGTGAAAGTAASGAGAATAASTAALSAKAAAAGLSLGAKIGIAAASLAAAAAVGTAAAFGVIPVPGLSSHSALQADATVSEENSAPAEEPAETPVYAEEPAEAPDEPAVPQEQVLEAAEEDLALLENLYTICTDSQDDMEMHWYLRDNFDDFRRLCEDIFSQGHVLFNGGQAILNGSGEGLVLKGGQRDGKLGPFYSINVYTGSFQYGVPNGQITRFGMLRWDSLDSIGFEFEPDLIVKTTIQNRTMEGHTEISKIYGYETNGSLMDFIMYRFTGNFHQGKPKGAFVFEDYFPYEDESYYYDLEYQDGSVVQTDSVLKIDGDNLYLLDRTGTQETQTLGIQNSFVKMGASWVTDFPELLLPDDIALEE